jgi:hypothetical protein
MPPKIMLESFWRHFFQGPASNNAGPSHWFRLVEDNRSLYWSVYSLEVWKLVYNMVSVFRGTRLGNCCNNSWAWRRCATSTLLAGTLLLERSSLYLNISLSLYPMAISLHVNGLICLFHTHNWQLSCRQHHSLAAIFYRNLIHPSTMWSHSRECWCMWWSNIPDLVSVVTTVRSVILWRCFFGRDRWLGFQLLARLNEHISPYFSNLKPLVLKRGGFLAEAFHYRKRCIEFNYPHQVAIKENAKKARNAVHALLRDRRDPEPHGPLSPQYKAQPVTYHRKLEYVSGSSLTISPRRAKLKNRTLDWLLNHDCLPLNIFIPHNANDSYHICNSSSIVRWRQGQIFPTSNMQGNTYCLTQFGVKESRLFCLYISTISSPSTIHTHYYLPHQSLQPASPSWQNKRQIHNHIEIMSYSPSPSTKKWTAGNSVTRPHGPVWAHWEPKVSTEARHPLLRHICVDNTPHDAFRGSFGR